MVKLQPDMAWRIHDNVVRGEIDNRVKGQVRGKIWLEGLNEPVELELAGNAHPDLAGCLLTFENPGEKITLRKDTHPHPVQKGTVGDMTASRKVRVYDVPVEEACSMSKRGEKPPEYMANSLYLEWFSEFNGRVVIESADYHVRISPPAWRMTAEEEEQRASDAAAGFNGFLEKLSEAVEAARHEPAEDKEWDEFDYERLLKESDARTDKYAELLDKYEGHPDAEELIAREMGWDTGDGEDEEDNESADWLDVDELNRICEDAVENPIPPDPETEGVDWVRNGRGDIKHPLSLRAQESVIALIRGLGDDALERHEDDDLECFISEFQITSAKLAGALDTLAYGRELREGPFVVAYLKRALDHLHKSQAGLERASANQKLPAGTTTKYRTELLEIRQEILRLMDEFRGR